MSVRVDLHTHSAGSPDGGLKAEDYRMALNLGKLDYIAITDHGSIEAALHIQSELGDLGERIIVGEEIKTTDGELIGLYLQNVIPEGMSPGRTVKAIREHGGLVYVPHPFETVRSGISEDGLEQIIYDVDIIETHNGRAVFQNKSKKAVAWAKRYDLPQSAGSDAHGLLGWCRTYSVLTKDPNRDNLTSLLRKASHSARYVGAGILYPKINRMLQKRRSCKYVGDSLDESCYTKSDIISDNK